MQDSFLSFFRESESKAPESESHEFYRPRKIEESRTQDLQQSLVSGDIQLQNSIIEERDQEIRKIATEMHEIHKLTEMVGSFFPILGLNFS